jgi:hypothetical protein
VDNNKLQVQLKNLIVFRRLCKLSNAAISFVISVRLSVRPLNNSASTGKMFVKFDTSLIFENLSTKSQFHSNLTRITDALNAHFCNIYEDLLLNSLQN